MEGADLLMAGTLFLFAAVVAVPLAARLGIGAVLGYLLAGIAIGPWGLGFISDVDEILHFSELCQQHFPHLHILARARGRVEAHELLQAGVTQFSRETFSSALELGRKTLVSLGMHPHQAQRAQLHFRRLDMRMLRELIPEHSDTVQISRAREARRELEEIFQREMQQERRQLDGWDEFE